MTGREKVQRVAKGRRPQYFADPATDKLLWMVLSLAGELSVTRQRLDTLERLLAEQSIIVDGALDDFTASDPTAIAEREALRQELVDRLLSVVRAELKETTDEEFPRSREEILKVLDGV